MENGSPLNASHSEDIDLGDNPFKQNQQVVIAALGQNALLGVQLSVLLGQALNIIHDVLDVKYCEILEYNEQDSKIQMISTIGWSDDKMNELWDIEPGSEFEFILKAKNPVISLDINEEDRFLPFNNLSDNSVKSTLSMLIMMQRQIFGILTVRDTVERDFSVDDISFVQSITNIIGSAIERKSYDEKLLEQTHKSQLLSSQLMTHVKCMNVIMHATSISDLLVDFTEVLCRDQSIIAVWVIDYDIDDKFNIRAFSSGILEDNKSRVQYLIENPDVLDNPAKQSIQLKSPTIVSHDIPGEKLKSIFIPLIDRDTIFGTLVLQIDNIEALEDTDNLISLANSLAFGINSLEISSERNRILSNLKIKEKEVLRLITAIEQSPSIVVITDLEGRIEYINPQFLRVTGYTRDEVIGERIALLRSGYTDDLDYRNIWNKITSGEPWQGVFKNRKKNGEFFWTAASISPVLTENGEIINYLSVQKDITDEKDIEEQLLHSQKMEALGRISGSIAHDFNNLLTAILGYAEVSLYNPRGDDIEENLLEIKETAITASRISRQLLTFSKKQVMDFEKFDFNHLLQNMYNLFEKSKRENIDLVLDLAKEPSIIKADKSKVHQVMLNLVLNASEAIVDDGRIIIKVENMDISDNDPLGCKLGISGSFVRVIVDDNGIGMNLSTIERIFDPFFTEKINGTGLGLSIVKTIVEQLNGKIHVESQPGEGSKFSLFFPCVSIHEEKSIQTNIDVSSHIEGSTVLLVDDEESILLVLEKMLSLEDISILIDNDPLSAIDRCKQMKVDGKIIDMVITDVKMPNMTGIEMVRNLIPIFPDIKIIYMSGYPEEFLQNEDLLPQKSTILMKPFTKDALMNKIHDVLQSPTDE